MDWSATFQPVWAVSLLPRSSSTPWEIALDLVDANLVARDPVGLIAASRSVEAVPLRWLPYLAEERSVDEFSSAWPEERQRAVTKASLGLHRIKGTRASLVRGLQPMGYAAKVVEWFEVIPPRRAYTFRVSITIDGARTWLAADRKALIRAANKAKNLHTKLEAVEFYRPVGPAALYVGGVLRRHRQLLIGSLPPVTSIQTIAMTFIGIAQTRRRTLIVGRAA